MNSIKILVVLVIKWAPLLITLGQIAIVNVLKILVWHQVLVVKNVMCHARLVEMKFRLVFHVILI